MNLRATRIVEYLRSVRQVARLRAFDTSTPEGRSLERYRRIVLSTGASVVGTAVSTLVGLVVVPVAIGYLGKEQYGLWAAINSFLPWVGLFNLGLVAALVVAISEAYGRDDREAARRYFSTSLLALLAIALALAALLAFALPVLPWARLLSVPPSIPGRTATSSVVVGLCFAIASLPLALVPQVYAGAQKAYVATGFATLGAVLSLGLLLLAVRLRGPLAAVVAATGGAGVVAALAGLAYLLVREMPWLRPHLAGVSMRSLRRLFSTAAPLYLFQLGALLVNQSQPLILARRAGLTTVADYDLLMRLYALSVGLITVSTASFAPAFREAFERGEHDWMRRSFWHLVRVRMTLAACAGGTLLLGGNFLLRVWLRRDDFQYGAPVWLALSALLLVAVWASSFLELMTILDRIWPQVAVVLAQGVATVGLTWALGSRMGVLGGLLAIAVPAAAFSGWMLPWLARRLVSSDARHSMPPGMR